MEKQQEESTRPLGSYRDLQTNEENFMRAQVILGLDCGFEDLAMDLARLTKDLQAQLEALSQSAKDKQQAEEEVSRQAAN